MSCTDNMHKLTCRYLSGSHKVLVHKKGVLGPLWVYLNTPKAIDEMVKPQLVFKEIKLNEGS